MRIYIDADYKCHTAYAPGLREVEAPYFDGRCSDFIRGYRFIPEGESWTRDDGEVFRGEVFFPWVPEVPLRELQMAYDLARVDELLRENAEMREALGYLGYEEVEDE